MKYKYEFEAPKDFEKGYCLECDLGYEEYIEDEYGDTDWEVRCVLGNNHKNCPLIEIGDQDVDK